MSGFSEENALADRGTAFLRLSSVGEQPRLVVRLAEVYVRYSAQFTKRFLASTTRAVHEQPSGKQAPYAAHYCRHPPGCLRRVCGNGCCDEGPADPEGEGQLAAGPVYRVFERFCAPEIYLQPGARSGAHRPFYRFEQPN